MHLCVCVCVCVRPGVVCTEHFRYALESVSTDLVHYLSSKGAGVALIPDLKAISPTHAAVQSASSGVRQSTNEVFMVAPTAFGFNEQAAQVRCTTQTHTRTHTHTDTHTHTHTQMSAWSTVLRVCGYPIAHMHAWRCVACVAM